MTLDQRNDALLENIKQMLQEYLKGKVTYDYRQNNEQELYDCEKNLAKVQEQTRGLLEDLEKLGLE